KQKVDFHETHSYKRGNQQKHKEHVSDRNAPEFNNPGGDDAEHSRLEHVESVRYLRELAITNIKPAQNDHRDRARHNEGDTGQHAAPQLAFQVTNIDRQLQRLRAGKHVAESHDFDEAIFGEPSALLHH